MKLMKLLAAAALASGAFVAQPAFAEDVKLEFVVWNYSLETIQDNIKLFEAANPGIKVNVTDYTWPDYQDSIVLRFRGNTPTDVIYGGQDWLPAWGAAGFIAPLDSVAPAADARRAEGRHRRLCADRRDLQGQGLRPALLRRHHLLHLQQEDPRRRRHRRADDLGRGDRGRRKAQGRRHGASDRL